MLYSAAYTAILGVLITVIVCVWWRVSINANREGRKFALFALMIALTASASWFFFRETIPEPIPTSALSTSGGMALFVSTESDAVRLRVSPDVDESGNISPRRVRVYVDPDSGSTGWALQLSGAWLVAGVESLDGSDVGVQTGSLLPTDEYLSGDPKSTALALPLRFSESTHVVSVPWIAPGRTQLVSGRGAAEFHMTLRANDLVLAGSTISAAWPSVGCANDLNQLLAETYLGKPLPKSVLHLGGQPYFVPKSCNVTLGGFTTGSDLFPDFASRDLNLTGAIGWEEQTTPASYKVASAKAVRKLRRDFRQGSFTLGPTSGPGQLSITARQLRLTSAHKAGAISAKQALSAGILGVALGALTLLGDLLLTHGWRGLFSYDKAPKFVIPNPVEKASDASVARQLRARDAVIQYGGLASLLALLVWVLRRRTT